MEVSSKYFQESLLWQRNQLIDGIVGVLDQTPSVRHPCLVCGGVLVFLRLRRCSLAKGEISILLPKHQLEKKQRDRHAELWTMMGCKFKI